MQTSTSTASYSEGPMFLVVGNTGENAGKFQLKDITVTGMDMTADFIQFLSSDDASSYMDAVYVSDIPAIKGWWDFNDVGGTPYDDEWFNNGTAFLCAFASGNEITFQYSGQVPTGSDLVITIPAGTAAPFICNPSPVNLTLGDITVTGMDMTADFFQFLSTDDASSVADVVYVSDIPAIKGWWDFNDIGGTPVDDLPVNAGGALLGAFGSGNEVVVTFPDPLASN